MEKDITRVGPRMRKVQNKEKLMQLPLVVANFIKDVIAMRSNQKLAEEYPGRVNCIDAKRVTEGIVDDHVKKLQQVVKIKLSDDLKEIIEAYFEEAG